MSALEGALGFTWDRAAVRVLPAHTPQRAVKRYHRVLAQHVWDAARVLGNPLTYPEVQTLLGGITVGGYPVAVVQQVTGVADAAQELQDLVRDGDFQLCEVISDSLHMNFAVPDRRVTPHGTWDRAAGPAVAAMTAELDNPFELAGTFFLFGALRRVYPRFNWCTSLFMMNGVLMSHGIDAIGIRAARAAEFNGRMAEFYVSRDGTAMFAFLGTCWDDAQ